MIKKESFNELKTGWMAPNGVFYPCDYMEHLITADEIWKELYNNKRNVIVETELQNLGWCEIQCITFMEHGFLFNYKGHLTQEQKAVVKPIFENNRQRILKSSIMDLEEELY